MIAMNPRWMVGERGMLYFGDKKRRLKFPLAPL